MISLTLQCCPTDLGAAFELIQLICATQKNRREETEFFLIYRKDCPLWVEKEFLKLTRPKFGRVKACQARNHAVGWPEGSNMLAGSAMQEMLMLYQRSECRNDAYLLFEPDCVPLDSDWLDQLSLEWDRIKVTGKECFGHWNMPGAIPENLHMNGNAVFSSLFHQWHPDIFIGPGTQGWDYWFRDKIIPISTDSDLIFQLYNCPTVTAEYLDGIQKNGRRPALLHGVKDQSARRAIWDRIHLASATNRQFAES